MKALLLLALLIGCGQDRTFDPPQPVAKPVAVGDSLVAVHSDSIFCHDRALWALWCEKFELFDGEVEFCGQIAACAADTTLRGFPVNSDTLFLPVDPGEFGLVRFWQQYPGVHNARWLAAGEEWWVRTYLPSTYDSLSVAPDSLGMVLYWYYYNELPFFLWGFPQSPDLFSPGTVEASTSGETSTPEPPSESPSEPPAMSVRCEDLDAAGEGESLSTPCYHNHRDGHDCGDHQHTLGDYLTAHPDPPYTDDNPCGDH